MNNQSIYTERENILPHHAEWLDGCGATWRSNRKFSKNDSKYRYIEFSMWIDNHRFVIADPIGEDSTHIPTGTEFCERVAEILGVEKPVFEQFGNSEQVDISKKETTTDHIPYVGQKVDEQDKLFPGRNNTMGEGSLTQEDIEILLGDSIVKPIKGMAIDVNLLGEDEREWLYVIDTGILSDWSKWTYCSYCPQGEVNLCEKSYIERLGITITESPAEFLKYVAQQTGKEYKKEWGQTHGNPRTSQPVSESYKFKTYRILDSLDGIPLDKRIPLSEWIPPVGKKVLLITKDWFMDGYFDRVESKIIFETVKGSKASSLDGHWMRIV